MEKLESILKYFEGIINVEHFKRVEDTHAKQLKYHPIDHICIKTLYPQPTYERFSIEEIHEDMGKMMYNELLGCLCAIETEDYSLPMIRANYGVGTVASVFGLKSRIINGNMPWVDHISLDEIDEIIAKGVPDLNTGFGKSISLTHEFYRQTLSKYPKCNEVIKIYHPDFEGPMDIAHLMCGSDIYLEMYDNPERIHALMQLITDTYIAIMKRTKPEINDEIQENCYHWNFLYGGKVVLRNDSAVNLSCDMYNEFVKPYDEQILDAFGGGSIHFCGRADHLVFEMSHTKNLKGMNFGQMEKYVFGKEYLDFLLPKFSKTGVPIIGYSISKDDLDKMPFEKYGTGISYVYHTDSKTTAMRFLDGLVND